MRQLDDEAIALLSNPVYEWLKETVPFEQYDAIKEAVIWHESNAANPNEGEDND